MKRYTRLRKRSKSKRSTLIRENDALMFQLLQIKRGDSCEICQQRGGHRRLGTFHILSKAVYPRIRYAEDNLLLVCFFPCHNLWHSDPLRAAPILKRIEELRGKDYETRLRALNAISPSLTTFKLEQIRLALTHFVTYGETS